MFFSTKCKARSPEAKTEMGGEGTSSPDTRIRKGAKIFLVAALLAFILPFVHNGSWTTSRHDPADLQQARQTYESTTLPPGCLLNTSDNNVHANGRDCIVEHQSDADTAQLYIWDYAAEDGDYVEVLVNGQPVSEPFMILNKPRIFSVPATGTVQVRGVHDGGGGITYAVYYDVNHTSYFNRTDVGHGNTYTLVHKE